ncbi:MAG TPA: bifunctional nuclease family protein [Candidatus Krumholzibacteria bacterium]|nr:bifunctional nuclease family protein [Candidatus Krumholzibacteria bacterium]HPD72748.1 bifunctional nuclease family protein [Candidatus Krumholzibacteria bacterium]HRY40320.1 bifunctional nuclease family protein [Candidatus Krumholzibacteria bacterium]
MIKVEVAGLSLDQRSQAPVVLLYIPPEEMCLPIWIGPAEAASIALALRGESFARPLTHDLLAMVIDGLGGRVERVVITDQRDSTYIARIFLGRDRDIVAVDARPSDSIALALRADAPIFLEEAVLAKARDSLLPLDVLQQIRPDPPDPEKEAE